MTPCVLPLCCVACVGVLCVVPRSDELLIAFSPSLSPSASQQCEHDCLEITSHKWEIRTAQSGLQILERLAS